MTRGITQLFGNFWGGGGELVVQIPRTVVNVLEWLCNVGNIGPIGNVTYGYWNTYLTYLIIKPR